jgi:hypothetical protein
VAVTIPTPGLRKQCESAAETLYAPASICQNIMKQVVGTGCDLVGLDPLASLVFADKES